MTQTDKLAFYNAYGIVLTDKPTPIRISRTIRNEVKDLAAWYDHHLSATTLPVGEVVEQTLNRLNLLAKQVNHCDTDRVRDKVWHLFEKALLSQRAE